MASDSAQRDKEARGRIGKHLRALREEVGMTQHACAVLAGVSRWVWTSWENGRASIPSETLARVYHAVGVDVSVAIPTLRAA